MLQWLNGDAGLAVQLLVSVLKVPSYELPLAENCCRMLADLTTPGAYFASDSAQITEHGMQAYLDRVDSLRRVLVTLDALQIAGKSLAREPQRVLAAASKATSSPQSAAQRLAPAYLRGLTHLARSIHMLYTFAADDQSASGAASGTVGFRQHLFVTSGLAQHLLIPHIQAVTQLWKTGCSDGKALSPALVSPLFVRALSLCLRLLALVTFGFSPQQCAEIGAVAALPPFVEALMAVGGVSSGSLPRRAAAMLVALVGTAMVNTDALNTTSHTPAKPAPTSGPQPIPSAGAAALSPSHATSSQCAAQLREGFTEALLSLRTSQACLRRELLSTGWVPLARGNGTHGALLALCAHTLRDASSSARSSVQPETPETPGTQAMSPSSPGVQARELGSLRVAGLKPVQVPGHAPPSTPTEAVQATQSAAAKAAARDAERRVREAVSAGVDVSRHGVQSRALGGTGTGHGASRVHSSAGLNAPLSALAGPQSSAPLGSAADAVLGAGDGEVPVQFTCALTGNILRQAVVADVDVQGALAAHSASEDLTAMRKSKQLQEAVRDRGGVIRYERSAIHEWLATQGSVDPLTGLELSTAQLRDDPDISAEITTWQLTRALQGAGLDMGGGKEAEDGEADFEGDTLYDF